MIKDEWIKFRIPAELKKKAQDSLKRREVSLSEYLRDCPEAKICNHRTGGLIDPEGSWKLTWELTENAYAGARR